MHIVTCRKPIHLAIFGRYTLLTCCNFPSYAFVFIIWLRFPRYKTDECGNYMTFSHSPFFFFFLPCSIHCFYAIFLSFILQLFSSSVESFFFHYICFSVFLNLASISLQFGNCESNKLLPWSTFVLFVTSTSWFFGIESSPFQIMSISSISQFKIYLLG